MRLSTLIRSPRLAAALGKPAPRGPVTWVRALGPAIRSVFIAEVSALRAIGELIIFRRDVE